MPVDTQIQGDDKFKPRLTRGGKSVGQTFSPTAPNQVWVTDITYIPTQEGWFYLAGVKDVFTCELVGYTMGERVTRELASQALLRAVQQKRSSPGLIHHADRGSQYCSEGYRKMLVQFGMRASMSRKGTAMTTRRWRASGTH